MKLKKTSSPGRAAPALPDVAQRVLVVAGGLFAFGVLAVATSGTANAQTHDDNVATQHSGASAQGLGSILPPLTGTVGSLLHPVTPVVRDVAELAAPVVNPVVDAAAPVLKPVLRPVDAVAGPVLAVAAPLVSPITKPVVQAAAPVIAPAATQLGLTQTVSATTPMTGRSDQPGTVQAVSDQPGSVVQAGGQQPAAVTPPAVAMAPAKPQSVPDKHVAWTSAAVHQPSANAGTGSSVPQGPRVPDSPMLGGSMGTVSTGTTGGGVAGAVLPTTVSGSSVDAVGWSRAGPHTVGPYWCYVFGRNHPS